MRRNVSSPGRVHARRQIGAVLMLVALLAQLMLPPAAAFAMMADPLAAAPICTTSTATGHDAGGSPGAHGKLLHVACPQCQAPAVVWGFPPPAGFEIAVPRPAGEVVWRPQTVAVETKAVAGRHARGPPGAA
ncbi:hypothetical protein GCM10011611_10520 [Aliidongia dinghuensis]|uniref:DUF2946 domain-containing protein n=1 Tax=Aliidongia dinghuensis TaxID=1867774 RepID=A0A8J3E222_9PROT|nr:hypothetical protein [Aliidongia dinghuensis]GGF06926.1 hypothetical protein GCM10011611_10520 [Aliidongia dinghuensis]